MNKGIAMGPDGPSNLASPKTRLALELTPDSRLQSQDGSMSYPVRNGIANFLSSQRWDSADNEHLLRLLSVARETDHLTAVKSVFDDPGYVTDSSRMLYLDLLPIGDDSVVLEIGASIGQHTSTIASRCQHVEALEVIPEQAEFAKLRCDQDGLSNVNVSIGGDDCWLPYQSEIFDVVILNYVLEWSAGQTELDPAKAHEQLIAECSRVLRPGGVLFLSTKNRFNLRLLRGGIDEHVEFRFGNALPRWLMRQILKYYPPSKSVGYLHSYKGLQEILRSHFDHLKPLLALPDGRHPRVYATFEADELSRLKYDETLLSAGRATAFFLRSIPDRAKKWFAPSLVFIAKKE